MLYASLVAAVVLVIRFAVADRTIRELKLSGSIRDSQTSLAAADAGLECALFWDLKYPDQPRSVFGGISVPDTLTDDLVGHWRFNDGPGHGTAADSSGNEYTGFLTNMDYVVPWVTGIRGTYAISLDGDDDAVIVDNETDLELETYTYAFWFNLDSGFTGGWRRILSKGTTAGCGARQPSFWMENDGDRLLFQHSTAAGTCGNLWAIGNMELDTWTHIGLTSSGDNGEIRLFIDGQLNNSLDHNNDLITGTDDLYIGTPTAGGGAESMIDDVRVYDRVISDAEIEALAGISSFYAPVTADQGDINCNLADITNDDAFPTGSGWVTVEDVANQQATSTFEVSFGSTCAEVTVIKNGANTIIDSRGYNTCDTTGVLRVERGLRAEY